MSLKIGDKVRFLNEVGGGIIVSRVDARMVMVRGEDGFEVPYPLTELLLDLPLEKRLREESKPPTTQTAERPTPVKRISPHIQLNEIEHEHFSLFLGFSAADESDVTKGPYDLYIINNSPLPCFVTLARWKGDRAQTFFAAKVNRNSARHTIQITAEELFLYTMLNVQALYFSDSLHQPRAPENVDIELKQQRFCRPGAFQANRFLKTSLLLFAVRDYAREAILDSLAQPESQTLIEEKEQTEKIRISQPHANNGEVVIDLHIEELIKQPTKMTPKEILDYQLNHFQHEMENALENHGIRRLVAIHGVGNGQLRRAVIDCLRTKFPQCEFQDASFREYGYGATLIMLHRNK